MKPRSDRPAGDLDQPANAGVDQSGDLDQPATTGSDRSKGDLDQPTSVGSDRSSLDQSEESGGDRRTVDSTESEGLSYSTDVEVATEQYEDATSNSPSSEETCKPAENGQGTIEAENESQVSGDNPSDGDRRGECLNRKVHQKRLPEGLV